MQAYQALRVCACVHAHRQASMCEVDRAYARMQVCVNACSWRGWCHGLVHWGRAEWSMAAAAYSDLMCTQSNKDNTASHHNRITGTSLGELGRVVVLPGFYGRPQQGLNVCGSVSHSVIHLTVSSRGTVRRHGGTAGVTKSAT